MASTILGHKMHPVGVWPTRRGREGREDRTPWYAAGVVYLLPLLSSRSTNSLRPETEGQGEFWPTLHWWLKGAVCDSSFVVCWNLLSAMLCSLSTFVTFFLFSLSPSCWITVSVLILATLPPGEPRNSLSGCTWAPLRSEMIPSLWTGSTDPLMLWKLEFKDRMGYSCTWQRPRVPSDQGEEVCTIRKQQQTDTGSPVWILMDGKALYISSPSLCQAVHMGPFSSVVSPFDFKLRKLPYPEIK